MINSCTIAKHFNGDAAAMVIAMVAAGLADDGDDDATMEEESLEEEFGNFKSYCSAPLEFSRMDTPLI